jgi:hydrogenase maturation factor
MCITRVGQVIRVSGGKAAVEFFDGRSLGDVDLSVVGAKEGNYVEVFGNMALSIISASEAKSRKQAWTEVKRAALKVPAEARRR